MKRKFLYLSLFLFLSLMIISVSNTESRLILELDIENNLPNFVGKKFTFKFTCVTKESTVHVIMYFDGLTTQPVFDEASDFFVNYEVTIDTVAADLLAGVQHTFSIEATDGIETRRIDSQMTVDIIDPSFSYISLTHVNEDNVRELITGTSVELHQNEYFILNWTATDEHMKGIKIYRNTLTDELFYASSASTILNEAHFAITTPNVLEQTFELKVVAFDEAGNTDTIKWDVKMIKPDIPYVPKEELEKIKLEEAEKRKMSQNGLVFSIIFCGGVGGIIIGILGANFGRGRVLGYMGTGISQPFKRKENKENEELTFKQWIRKYAFSKFGLFIISTISILLLWALVGWIFIKYITPKIFDYSIIEIDEIFEIGSGFFWQSFIYGFIWSFPFFCTITFFISFITRKGKFTELYVQTPPVETGKIACMVISVFTDRDGKTKIATSSFIDAVNGNYLPIEYRNVERLQFELKVENEVYTGVYIPALEIKVEIDGVSIDVFKIHGAACIQELIDSKNSTEMQAKFALITELQKLSDENTELIRILTKKTYAGDDEVAEEFRLFIEELDATGSADLKQNLKDQFESIMKEKKIPTYESTGQQQPASPPIPTTQGAE